MDPLSQAFIGSGVAQSFSKKGVQVRQALFCGAIGGLMPDIDILIRSNIDPLKAIEYHRHFTHSLFFIPFGGLFVAALLWLIFFRKNKKQKFSIIYLFSTLGYATHGLLDSCTAYGTQILWPFSDYRASWSVISIIDPLFTLPLIAFCILSYFKKERKYARSGIYLCMIYLLYGFYNQLSAKSYILDVAKNRGHEVEKIFMNPSLANNILWRSVYKSGNNYYIDAVNVRPFRNTVFYKGSKVEAIDKELVFDKIPKGSKQRDDIRRFSHFTKGYIYLHPNSNNVIADLRYSAVPNDIESLWGIKIDEENPQNHVKFISLRKVGSKQRQNFVGMVKGE